MVLDRRERYGLVQALLRARNRKHEGNLLENVAQTGAASSDGSYGEPAFGGMGFPSTSQPGVTAGDKAASQSRKLIPTPRPHLFRDPARFSHAGEVSDMATARGIPAHDQLAFKGASGTSSRLANPQTTCGRPLAVNAGVVLPQRHWGSLWERLFPSYCTPTDDNNLTFPPLINQDRAPLTEADKDACHDQFDHDEKQCYENHSYKPDILRGCIDRAKTIRDLCLRGETETSPWNDFDSDGVKLPVPGKKKPKMR
jgi:hypothetical protein